MTETVTPTPSARPRRRLRARWLALSAVVAVLVGAALGSGIARLTRGSGGAAGARSLSSLGLPSSGYAPAHGKATQWSLASLRHPSATVSLGQFAGRPVVVNLWASWCTPCRKEMPALAAAAAKDGDRVAFVGVDTNDRRSAAMAFLAATGVSYPVAFDPNGTVASAAGVYGLPTTLFVSAQGNLVGRQVGPLTEARAQQLVSKVFGIKS